MQPTRHRPPPSQAQIARESGVSQSVVSRVLAGKAAASGISGETARRVLRVARRRNYRPNPIARMLLARKSGLVGVMVPSFHDPFLANILKHLRELTAAEGLSLLATECDSANPHPEDLLRLASYHVAGCFVVGSYDFRRWPEPLLGTGVPVIQIGDPAEHPDVICCSINNRDGARALFAHLTGAGHRRLGLVCDAHPPNQQRLAAFAETAPGARVEILWQHVSPTAGFEAGIDAAKKYLSRKRATNPDALVAMDDIIALGVLHGLLANGVAVPGQVAVTGFDGIDAAAMVWPRLTTMRQPVAAMVAHGVDILLERAPAQSAFFAPALVVGESTRPHVPSR